MRVTDRLYGSHEINEPVLVDLINSPSLQRLKGIAQFGVPDEFYCFKNFSRYEHSVGVMLLLRALGADEKEQIAGLLHDVSHMAFSHVYDWIINENGGQEEFQDNNHESFIKNSEIPNILNKHSLNYTDIINYHVFTLLELPAPDICADRVDYALREMPPDIAQNCLNHLIVKDGKLVFNDLGTAKLFAENFLKLQKNHWGGIEASNRYYHFAKMMRRALKIGLIELSDFKKDDSFVIRKVLSSNETEVIRVLRTLRQKDWTAYPRSDIKISKKFRHVDPLVLSNDRLIKLSDLDLDYKQSLEKERQYNQAGLPMVVI